MSIPARELGDKARQGCLVGGGEQRDWQLGSGALCFEGIFGTGGLVIRRGTGGSGSHTQWKPDGLLEDFQLVIQPLWASVLRSVKQENTVSAVQSPAATFVV